MTGQLGKYSRVHGGVAPKNAKGEPVSPEEWKRNFIEQIYGVSSGPEFDEIKRVLDVSADIELDKIGRADRTRIRSTTTFRGAPTTTSRRWKRPGDS
jgi:hypothetical protein